MTCKAPDNIFCWGLSFWWCHTRRVNTRSFQNTSLFGTEDGYIHVCVSIWFFFFFALEEVTVIPGLTFILIPWSVWVNRETMLAYIAADTPNKAFEHFRYTTILVTIYEGLPKNTKRTFKHYSQNGITWYILLVSFNFRKRENLIYISVL